MVPTDVTDSAAVRVLFDRTVSSFGRVDVLLNNAGIFGPAASIADIDDEQWHSVWRTNVDGAAFCAGGDPRHDRATAARHALGRARLACRSS